MAVSRVLPARAQLLAANCAGTDAVGDCVYVSGERVGDRIQVTKINPRNLSQVPAIGVIEVKETSTTCSVRIAGVLPTGVYAGLVPQTQLWVGLDGRLTASQAGITALSGQRVAVQPMGVALASDLVLVKPHEPFIRIA